MVHLILTEEDAIHILWVLRQHDKHVGDKQTKEVIQKLVDQVQPGFKKKKE